MQTDHLLEGSVLKLLYSEAKFKNWLKAGLNKPFITQSNSDFFPPKIQA